MRATPETDLTPTPVLAAMAPMITTAVASLGASELDELVTLVGEPGRVWPIGVGDGQW